jgi:hypothetical protein
MYVCELSKKYDDWPVSLRLSPHLLFSFYNVLKHKPKMFNITHYTVVTHYYKE